MVTVFLSWYDGFLEPAGIKLRTALEELGVTVIESPRSPHSGSSDPRWTDWYDKGLIEAINQADAFVAVITKVYDSTWMAVEFAEAFRRNRQGGRPRLFLYRIDESVLPLGFKVYEEAATELVREPIEAAKTIVTS